MTTFFKAASCIFQLIHFNSSNYYLPLPFIKFVHKLVWHMKILKQCIPENNLFGQNYHTVKFLHSFQLCTCLITLYTYDTIIFFFASFNVFSAFIANDYHLWQMTIVLVSRFDDLITTYNTYIQLVGYCWIMTTKLISPYFLMMNHFSVSLWTSVFFTQKD